MIRREVAIVGIGQSAYGKALPAAAWDLAVEAVLAALRDAGLEPADVDGISRFAPPFEQVSEPMLVRALGIPELRFFAESPLGGEALGAVIAHAAAAIMAGLARVVVVYRALSQSKGGRFGRADRGGPSGPPGTDPAAGIVGCDAREVRAGLPVQVRFTAVSDEITLPYFEPVPEPA